MNHKEKKWEKQYNEYNTTLDTRLSELENKVNNKSIKREEYTEYQNLLKIKSNMPQLKNLSEYILKVEEIKEKIEDELVNRSKSKDMNKSELDKLDLEDQKINAKIMSIQKQLKDSKLSEAEKTSLEEELKIEIENKRKNNNKYSAIYNQNKEVREETEFTKMSSKELREAHKKLCMKISKSHYFGKKLIEGQKLQDINLQYNKEIDESKFTHNLNINKIIENRKKFSAKGKQAQKLEELKDASKENIELKLEKNDKDIEKTSRKLNLENVKKEIKEEVDKEGKKEGEALVPVSEFDQKHPRIAKIKNFFKGIKDKVTEKLSKEEPKAEKESKAEKEPKSEEKQKEETQYDKFRKSMSYKEIEKYDVSDIAEKGLEGLQNEKINKAKETLIAAKVAGGMTKEAAEKSVDNAINKLHGNDSEER